MTTRSKGGTDSADGASQPDPPRRGKGRPRHDPGTRVPIGMRLKLIRQARGLGQEELRELCGVSKSTFSSWENAKSYPTFDQLVVLCRALNVSSDVLLGLQPLVLE